MKKLLIILILLVPIVLSGQTFDKTVIAPKIKLTGGTTGIDFTGTYTENVIDLSNITIDYTGSSGPAPIRIGTYGSPLANADEDQSGMLRLYGQTSANGTSYDRGVFVALKTTGTKSIFPIAGLAEVLAQTGAGPVSVAAGQFIADLHTTDAVLAATTGGGEGMYGAWFKVTAIDGATTNANSVIAPIWVDNQLYGNNANTSNKEFGIRATTGGTVPKSFIGFETSSDGWGQLLYFDATAYDHQPVSNTSLKVMLNTTQYYLPLSTSSTSFTWGYPIAISGIISAEAGIELPTESTHIWAAGGSVVLATAGTDVACADGTRFWTELMIPYNVTLTGLSYLVGSVGGTDSVVVQLVNSAGTEVATSRAVGGAAAIVGTAAEIQSVPFTAPYAATAGLYYAVVQFNGTTAKFRAYPITGSKFIAGSVGGTWLTAAGITPGTTFTADKGPICITY